MTGLEAAQCAAEVGVVKLASWVRGQRWCLGLSHLGRVGCAAGTSRCAGHRGTFGACRRPVGTHSFRLRRSGAGVAAYHIEYKSTIDVSDREVLEAVMLTELAAKRQREIERGISLVGPHRDDLVLNLVRNPPRALPATARRGHTPFLCAWPSSICCAKMEPTRFSSLMMSSLSWTPSAGKARASCRRGRASVDYRCS